MQSHFALFSARLQSAHLQKTATLHDQKKSIISFVDFSTVCNLDGENIDATYKCGKAGITVGDVNDDNDINQKDILLLKKYLAKWNVDLG